MTTDNLLNIPVAYVKPVNRISSLPQMSAVLCLPHVVSANRLRDLYISCYFCSTTDGIIDLVPWASFGSEIHHIPAFLRKRHCMLQACAKYRCLCTEVC